MKTSALLLLALTALPACRTSRNTVEIQDTDGPARPPSPDYPNIGRSVQTTFAVSAISLPIQALVYEYLDLTLNRDGETAPAYQRLRYKTGESFTIDPNAQYEVILTAMRAGKELYSTKFCVSKSRFYAQQGPNLFTAALCAPAKDP